MLPQHRGAPAAPATRACCRHGWRRCGGVRVRCLQSRANQLEWCGAVDCGGAGKRAGQQRRSGTSQRRRGLALLQQVVIQRQVDADLRFYGWGSRGREGASVHAAKRETVWLVGVGMCRRRGMQDGIPRQSASTTQATRQQQSGRAEEVKQHGATPLAPNS